jgi:hypothetical protein
MSTGGTPHYSVTTTIPDNCSGTMTIPKMNFPFSESAVTIQRDN